MPVTNYDGLLESWAGQIEALEQNLENMYGPPGITPTLPDITTYDGLLEAIAEETEKAYVNIAKLNGAYHDSITDVYAMTLPATFLDWMGIKKLGGKTIVWNQLVDSGTTSVDTISGHKYYTRISGTESVVTSDGTAITIVDDTADMVVDLTLCFGSGNEPATASDFTTIFTAHLYPYNAGTLLSADVNNVESRGKDLLYGETLTRGSLRTSDGATTTSTKRVRTPFIPVIGGAEYVATVNGSNDMQIFYAYYYSTNDASGFIGYTPDVNSTKATITMPQDAAYVRLLYRYPNDRSFSSVTEVVDNTLRLKIDDYPIPAEVQALEGYGLSCPGAYNYIDFEEKKFVQNVGFIDLSTLAFGYGPTVGWSATLPNVKNPADDDTAFNGLSATLKVTDRNTQATAFSGGTDAGMVSVAGGKVYIGTGSISIVPSGTLVYELDTPVETDISEYLQKTDLDVVAGGAVIFPNANGADYHIPVPSEVEYIGK